MPALHCATPALILACLLTTVAAAAETADSFEATRNMAQAGAAHLALRGIDAQQPTNTAAPRWVEWERLRLQLLLQSGRNDEVLQRVGLLSLPARPGLHAELHALAAHAGLALGRTAIAREHAGRALWTPGLDAGALRELRLLVIRSQVQEIRADDAYRSMLRFEQDYRPLDAATATGFVDALLDLGLAKEAVNWLGLLEERGATKLRLRLHTGVVTPQDVITQARAALARSDEPHWWRILLEAAERQKNGVLRIAALERLLDVKHGISADIPDADANRLWEAYAGYARDAANGHHLLTGDDANWLEFAVRHRAAEPAVARAYFAYLARHARIPAVQQDAQTRLSADYAAAKLPRTGLRVFSTWPGGPTALLVQTRHTLGMLAGNIGDHPRALQYWQGLPAPEHMPTSIWQLRLSALALRAARPNVAADIARVLAAERSVIPSIQLPEWIVLAQQLADHGLHDAAQALFERVLPHADAAQARIVLSGIARTHEARNQPLPAADFYLRSALRAKAADAAAAEARLLAGLSLARAGLHDDARAQFEWLVKNARDPAQIAVARRELGF